MIAIISEYRYTLPELKKLKEQQAVVNYTLLPQFYQSYSQEITKINYTLIRKMQGVIFRLSEYYAGTKDAIEYALSLKKPVKIINSDGKEYKITSLDEWKVVYKDSNNRNEVHKHTVLLEFEQHRNKYYEHVNIIKAKEKYQQAVDGIEESKEEIERFVHAFAPQYKLDVNYNDWVEVCNAYRSLKFYYDNDMPYELNHNEVFTVGAMEPYETGYFDEAMFDMDVSIYDCICTEENYGNETLLEDMIYKVGVEA